MFKIYGGATKFTQWTKDQKLIMSELPIGADVMFYNDPNEDEPTITEVYEIHDEEGNAFRVCDVPNIFLTETKRIKVRIPKRVRGLYGNLHSVAGQNEKYFEVEPAEKPEDYVYEKTVTNTIDPKRLPEGVPYVERTYGVVLEETELVDGIADLKKDIPIIEGEKYTVYLDNGNYETICKKITMYGQEVLILGNSKFFGGEDSGEPFWIATSCGMEQTQCNDTTPGTKISITGPSENIRKIDPACMPYETWIFTLEDGNTVTKKVAVIE